MKFHIVTYGCQMNERDTEAVGFLLRRNGYEAAAGESDADVVIVNTCSVRGKAEEKALGKLGLLVAGRKLNPGLRVGAMGCMAQRLGTDLLRKVPGIDFAVGTHRLSRVADIIRQVMDGRGPVLETGDEGDDFDALAGHTQGPVSAFVNILLGCDRRCAYCVVPAVRGAEWSRPAPSIVEEVRRVVAGGAREVTLLGQSVTSYGRRNEVWPAGAASPRGFRGAFPRLLEALDGIDGLRRVRFTSNHPSGCTAELFRAMADLPSVCEHIHLPCQSGSDRILRKMRRGYTAAGFRRAVDRLRAAVPGVAVTTDIIVGFPTETPEDFEATSRFMEEIGFDNAFIFKYSPRPGTPAADWVDDVPAEEKLRRNKQLLAEQDRRSLAINRRMIGSCLEALVEGVSLRNKTRWSGRARTNKIVVFEPAATVRPGDLLNVAIEDARPQTLYGRAADGQVLCDTQGGGPREMLRKL